MKNMNLDEVKTFIRNEGSESKIYLGCDSELVARNGKWFINFYSVVVIHRNGKNGCKVFGEMITERDHTPNKKKPQYRLMQEVFKVSELYLKLSDCFDDKYVEVHLDLNPSKKYVSNMVVDQAIGYVKAMCNVTPLIKPDSWAATAVADKLLRIAA